MKAISAFFTKNPIVIAILVAVVLVPAALTVAAAAAVGSLVQGIVDNNANTDLCTSTYKDTIDNNLTDKDIDKATVLEGCPKDNVSYDYSLWYEIQDKADGYYAAKDDYASHKDEFNALLKLAIEASTQGTTDQSAIDAQTQDIKDTFAGFVTKWGDKGADSYKIWKDISDYAASQIQFVGNGDFDVAAMISAAKSKVSSRSGLYYTFGHTWSKSKQAYCDGSKCGFLCANFVGYAVAAAYGMDTTNGIPAKVGGTTAWASFSASQEYNWLIGSSSTGNGSTGTPHGVNLGQNLSKLQPGDLFFLSEPGQGLGSGSLSEAHVGIYGGLDKSGTRIWYEASFEGRYLSNPISSSDTSSGDILERHENTPWFMSAAGQTYGFVRPYIPTSAGDWTDLIDKGYATYSGPTVDGTITKNGIQAQQYALGLIQSDYVAKYNWTKADGKALIAMWGHESGWSYKAFNPGCHTSKPATAYWQAYGIPQSCEGSKMATMGDDWKTNYQTQVKWGLEYIRQKYGSPSKAWALWQQQGTY